jgi:hypothetical protein
MTAKARRSEKPGPQGQGEEVTTPPVCERCRRKEGSGSRAVKDRHPPTYIDDDGDAMDGYPPRPTWFTLAFFVTMGLTAAAVLAAVVLVWGRE